MEIKTLYLLTFLIVFLSFSNNVKSKQSPNSKSNNKEAEIILLGCMHDSHEEHVLFSTKVLKNIINKLQPDIVLIEYPVNKFKDGKPLPKTIQTLERKVTSEDEVAWAYCKRTGSICLPYDIKDRNQYYADVDFFKRINKLNKAKDLLIKKELDPVYMSIIKNHSKLFRTLFMNSSPKVINSEFFDKIVEEKRRIQRELDELVIKKLTQSEYSDVNFPSLFQEHWQKRNNKMAENICTIAKEHPNKRILVNMGFEHRYIVKDLLIKSCSNIKINEYWELIKK